MPAQIEPLAEIPAHAKGCFEPENHPNVTNRKIGEDSVKEDVHSYELPGGRPTNIHEREWMPLECGGREQVQDDALTAVTQKKNANRLNV